MKADPLAAKLEKAAKKHGGLSMLAGIVGDGAKSGRVRLYLRPELDWYVDFSEKAVLHRAPLPADSALAGGSLLWVIPGTKLNTVEVTSLAEQASFLRGSLMDAGAGGTPDEAAMAALPATVVASSGLCALTVVGTIVVATITIASYNLCGTSGGTAPLTSALQGNKCVGVTTNATVICHPQTSMMAGPCTEGDRPIG